MIHKQTHWIIEIRLTESVHTHVKICAWHTIDYHFHL